MMKKHTPGTWYYTASDEDGLVYGANDTLILPHLILGRTPAEQHANARLIAAAPDLLAACEAVMEALENMTTDNFSRGADKPCRDMMAAAIKKAIDGTAP